MNEIEYITGLLRGTGSRIVAWLAANATLASLNILEVRLVSSGASLVQGACWSPALLAHHHWLVDLDIRRIQDLIEAGDHTFPNISL